MTAMVSYSCVSFFAIVEAAFVYINRTNVSNTGRDIAMEGKKMTPKGKQVLTDSELGMISGGGIWENGIYYCEICQLCGEKFTNMMDFNLHRATGCSYHQQYPQYTSPVNPTTPDIRPVG